MTIFVNSLLSLFRSRLSATAEQAPAQQQQSLSTPTIDALSPAIVARWLASRLVGRCTFSDVQQEKATGEWSGRQGVLGLLNSVLLLICTEL
jgi:hypothetical protein